VPETPAPAFLPILRVLRRHAVDFIVVDGVAAVIQGAPIMTLDLDVLYSADSDNLARLLTAIEDLDGHYRLQPEKPLRPQLSHLASGGHNLLTTRLGPLDLLGSIGRARTYRELLPHSIRMDIGDAVTVSVLDLESLIGVKEEVAGEKDRAMLPILRRTLEQIRRP
jgi:hypothetical protein